MGTKTASTAQAGHCLSHLQMCHAFTYGLHDASVFRARHKRQRRLHLIFVLNDQNIGKVQAGSLDLQQHLARFGLGCGQLGPGQGVNADRVFTEPGMHFESPKRLLAS